MTILTISIGFLGSLISYYFDWGLSGTSFFILFGLGWSLISYFYSDRLVLRASKAKKIKKDVAPELFEIIDSLSKKANIPIPSIYIMEENAMNAFATGRDYNHSAVAVSKGLLVNMSKEEVEGVLAHEISHIKNYDMKVMVLVSLLVGFISLIADIYWFSSISNKVQEKDNSGIAAIVGLILAIFAPISAFLIQLAISKKREYMADLGSVNLTQNKRGLISALKKISMDQRLPKHYSVATAHLYFNHPSSEDFIENLFSTHPPIEDRIKLLENL